MPSAAKFTPQTNQTHLCSSDSTTLTSTTLSRAQVSILTTNNSLRLLYNLLALSQDQFDVAWVGHVWVDLENLLIMFLLVLVSVLCHGVPYTTMGTVCSSALLGCLVDLDVLDDQVAGIKTLGICVGFGVLEESEEELGRLDWPSCAGNTELLAYYFRQKWPLTSYRKQRTRLVPLFQFHQHNVSWGQPPCALGRSQGT